MEENAKLSLKHSVKLNMLLAVAKDNWIPNIFITKLGKVMKFMWMFEANDNVWKCVVCLHTFFSYF